MADTVKIVTLHPSDYLPRQRFHDTLAFNKPAGRLPMIEWVPWWDKTVDRWQTDGLETAGRDYFDLQEQLGLDVMVVLMGAPYWPEPEYHGGPIIHSEREYDGIRSRLFADSLIDDLEAAANAVRERHERGEIILRLWLDRFFGFPCMLFGIENHLHAFYDLAFRNLTLFMVAWLLPDATLYPRSVGCSRNSVATAPLGHHHAMRERPLTRSKC